MLILGVEAEFAPLFPSEDPQHRGDSATLSALISPFKSLIRWFRTSDSASPTFCCRIHTAAASVISVWARGMADRGITTLSRYYSGNPHELRSSALDVLVTLAIVCKVRVYTAAWLDSHASSFLVLTLMVADCITSIASRLRWKPAKCIGSSN